MLRGLGSALAARPPCSEQWERPVALAPVAPTPRGARAERRACATTLGEAESASMGANRLSPAVARAQDSGGLEWKAQRNMIHDSGCVWLFRAV